MSVSSYQTNKEENCTQGSETSRYTWFCLHFSVVRRSLYTINIKDSCSFYMNQLYWDFSKHHINQTHLSKCFCWMSLYLKWVCNHGAASSSMAVYFGQREPARGQGCCCCCWVFSFRFFTLQTHPTLHHTGQRLMNRSSVWMDVWLACSVFWTWWTPTYEKQQETAGQHRLFARTINVQKYYI